MFRIEYYIAVIKLLDLIKIGELKSILFLNHTKEIH